ncbi:MAG: DUF3098 domain-containing protein [Chitinophagaceae bacterium]
MEAKKEKSKKPESQPLKKTIQGKTFLFSRENYQIMIAGIVIFILGLMLMAGGKSTDPNQFHPSQVYSFRRITVAPIVVMVGLLVEIYAIMKKPKPEPTDQH